MGSTAAIAGWYGFDIDDNGVLHDDGVVRMQQLDNKYDVERIKCENEVAEVITLLDGFYDGRQVKPLAPPTVVITKWGFEWLRRTLFGDVSVELAAADAIRSLDVEANDPLDYVEAHTHTYSKAVVVQGAVVSHEEVVKVKQVLKKGKRTNFAACIAHIAYNKFGARPMSEANILVTRKWIQKYLAEPEFKDLRVVDKNLAIDRALFLSFVPTNDFRTMKIATASRAWQKRVDPRGLLGGLFGKAFMVVRDDVPDGHVFA
nr:MAG: hypothetical protein [Tombusviridae sp.]